MKALEMLSQYSRYDEAKHDVLKAFVCGFDAE